MPLVRRILSLVLFVLTLTAVSYGQGKPSSLWMRGGGYWSLTDLPVWSQDGKLIAAPRLYSVDIIRASDGMLMHSIAEPAFSRSYATVQFLPDNSLGVFDNDGMGPNGIRNRVTFYAASTYAVQQTIPLATGSTAPAISNFLVDRTGNFAILNGNLYSINLPGPTLSPTSPSYQPGAPYVNQDGTGNFYSFGPLSDSVYGEFLPASGPIVDALVSPTTGATLWPEFVATQYQSSQYFADQANPFSPDMSIWSNVSDSARLFASLLDPVTHQYPYLGGAFADQVAWPPVTSGLFAMSGASYGAWSQTNFSNLWSVTPPAGGGYSLVFSPTGTQLAAMPSSTSNGGTGYGLVHDGQTGAQVTRLTWAGNRTGLVHSPDGTLVAASSWTSPPRSDGTVTAPDLGIPIWDTGSGDLMNTIWAGNGIQNIAFVDNNTIVAGYSIRGGSPALPGGNLAAFNVRTGVQLWQVSLEGVGTSAESNIDAVQVKAGVGLASIGGNSADNTGFFVFNPSTGNVTSHFYVQGNAGIFRLSPDGTKVATCINGVLQLTDLSGNAIGGSVSGSPFGATFDLAWSPDGSKIVVVGTNPAIPPVAPSAYIYTVTAAGISTTRKGIGVDSESALAVSWSGDGSAIALYQLANDAATGSTDLQLAIVDPVSGSQKFYYASDVDVLADGDPSFYGIDFDPTGQTMSFGGKNGLVATAWNPLYATKMTAFSLSPSTVVGGAATTGKITISKGGAPVTGSVVFLAVGNSAASAPLEVLVPPGQRIATFAISSKAVDAATVGPISATIGDSTLTANLTVTAPVLKSLALKPTAVVGGVDAVATVTIASPAPASGLVIALSSNSAFATAPPTVTIPASATTATFNVSTTAVATPGAAMISATVTGTTKTVSLSLLPPSLSSFTISTKSVVGGQSLTATINLSSPAPAAGMTVTISSSPIALIMPSTVTIPGGTQTATFSVGTVPEPTTSAPTLYASLNGIVKTESLTIRAPALGTLVFSPSSVIGGGTSQGTIIIGSPAPKTGLPITLSSDATFATVAPQVKIAPGATSVTFTVKTSHVATTGVATITFGLNGVTKTAIVTVKP